MGPAEGNRKPDADRAAAQGDRRSIRTLSRELASEEIQAVLALTPDQQSRFEEWSRAKLATLAKQFDIDSTVSQKRASWGMRIAPTVGALALCAALVLFFTRYWVSEYAG
jgi:cytochrome c-type biogenesis protein CcmH/NrfG